VNVVRPVAKLVGIHLPEGKRPKVADGKLKVAAVGFSRTGTVSCDGSVLQLSSFFRSHCFCLSSCVVLCGNCA
jgi:hypothetical protein